MLIEILASLSIILLVFYFWSVSKYDYWKKRNVKFQQPVPLFGNYAEYILQRKGRAQVAMDLLKQYPQESIVGAYLGTEPLLLIQDPELLKLVMTKDFYYFNVREHTHHNTKEFVTRNLFFAHGDNWRVVRQNLTPLFSSAKMKNMFYLVEKCTRVFEQLLDKETKVKDVVEIRSVMLRYTMDCICSCAFGIDSKVMESEVETNPFKNISGAIFQMSIVKGLRIMTRAIWPSVFYGLGLAVYPKQLYDFFSTVLINVFKERNYSPSPRQDFVDMVMSLKKENQIIGDSMNNMKGPSNEKVSIEVNDELLISLCVLFFAAGYETSSSTLSLTLFELAKHPEAQEKAFVEVDTYLSTRGKVHYDCTSVLPYLNQCMEEALRLHPILPIISREVYEDYKLPDGTELTKGLKVHVPVQHLHRQAKYFPNPDEFRPERFSPEGKKNIVPYTYLPFGEGPRICIGLRFGKMQVLAGLVTILKKYRVELAPGQSAELEYEPNTANVAQTRGGIYLRLVPREGWQQRVFNDEGAAH